MFRIHTFALFAMLGFSSVALAEDTTTPAEPAPAGDEANCDGKEGQALEKCEKAKAKGEKKATRMAKQDARSLPFLPSQLDAKFGSLDAANPFATETYRVRYNACGVPQIDAYTLKAAQIKGTVVMARYFVDQVKAGNKDVLVMAPALVAALVQVPLKGQALVAEGQALLAQIPQIMASQPMKIIQAQASLRDGITNMTNAVAEAPAVIKSAATVLPKQ